MSAQTQQQKDSINFFKDERYVLLNGAMPPEKCAELSKYMLGLVENGIAIKDEQCPLSYSVYGDPILDSILGEFAKPLSENLGIRLLPTYSYARVYQRGEVLPSHLDRESCEISGTMTLGFDGKTVWPIYIAQDSTDTRGHRIDLSVGDLLMYRGEEIPHWRKEFKGEWQCQVFFHYIDADGPHKDKGLEYDGRDSLGVGPEARGTGEGGSIEEQQRKLKERLNMPSADQERVDLSLDIDKEATRQGAATIRAGEASVIPKMEQSRPGVFPIYGGVMIPSWDLDIPGIATLSRDNYESLTFNEKECQSIIDLSNDYYPESGSVGGGKDDPHGTVSEIRIVELYNIPLEDNTKWVFDRIARAVSVVNNEFFNFDIMGITHELQLLHYKTDATQPGHYDWHIDMGGAQSSTRKISVSVQLSNPDEYTGGELVLNNSGQYVQGLKERGTMTCFPSYLLHKVNPMTSGDRWALVIWVHGSSRFR